MVDTAFLFSETVRPPRNEVIIIDTIIQPCKSPVSWVGNKSPILGIILAMFPLDFDRYIDVFGGSGSVLLGKPPGNHFEVYNDFDHDLTNLFHCMKERPLELIRELGFLTLNSRDDFYILKKYFDKEEFTDSYLEKELQLTQILLPQPTDEEVRKILKGRAADMDVKRAACYLKLLRYSYSSSKKSFASQPFDIRHLFHLIWQVSARLSNVVIENQDFEKVVRHYDRKSSLSYFDPPYVTSEHFYKGGFGMDDHIRLYNLVCSINGKCLISYNDCPWVRETYKDFPIFDFTRIHSMAQRYEAGKQFPELLIGNYDLFERERAKPLQMSLFQDDDFDHEKILKECILQCKVKL